MRFSLGAIPLQTCLSDSIMYLQPHLPTFHTPFAL